MGLVRSSSGLLVYDAFSTDSSASYTTTGGTWVVSGGEYYQTAAGSHSSRRNSITTAKCVTARVYAASDASYAVATTGIFTVNSGWWGAAYTGYLTYWSHDYAALHRIDAENNPELQGAGLDLSAGYMVQRVYLTATGVVGRLGATALSTSLSGADTTYTTGLSGGVFQLDTGGKTDWLDIRTSHLITGSGMTDGHYLRVSDGTTAAEAVASGGTASVDAGLVLFPLASVQVRTASGGGGSLIDEITSAALTDMGGGDAFTYSGIDAPTIVASQVASDIVVTW